MTEQKPTINEAVDMIKEMTVEQIVGLNDFLERNAHLCPLSPEDVDILLDCTKIICMLDQRQARGA